MAIETVTLYQNTGVLQDEVLCHRLGLIPFKTDPLDFKFRTTNEELTADNSLKFKLHIVCDEKNLDPLKKCLPIYSRDLVWQPQSEAQKSRYLEDPPKAVVPDILITKLRPGQEIEADLYLERGIGKTHAKWSPVAPATYRLLPKIGKIVAFEIRRSVFPAGALVNEEAAELKEICPMGVFDIEDTNGVKQCVAAYPRQCTTCRACIERFPGQVEIRKIKDHFICKRATSSMFVDSPSRNHRLLDSRVGFQKSAESHAE